MLAGFLLGCTVAYTFYRQQFPPLCSRAAGEALSAQALSGGGPGGGGSPGGGSEVELPYAAPVLPYGSTGGRYSPLDSAVDRISAVNAERSSDGLPV